MSRWTFTTWNALRKSTPVTESRRLILIAVGALGVSCVMTQLALMRELLGVFAGNEMVLGVALGLWLLLMGIGTWLGRTSDRLRNPLAALVIMEVVLALIPLAQVFLLRALRNVVFIRGAAVSVTETVGATLVLLLPYCVVAGYALTLACAILARQQGPGGIGRAYVADSIGSIIGGLLFSFVLVRALDHLAILLWPAVVNLLVAALLGAQVRRTSSAVRRFPVCVALLGLGLIAPACLLDLDAVSTRLQYPRQRIIAKANSPYGKLVVTESDGQFDFLENGIPMTSTRDDQHVEETVHYAMAQRPEARRVLLISGGISGTAREILKYKVGAVDYVELDPLILALGRRYLPANLADGRIRVINTDGRLFVKQSKDSYDVVIIDVPAPATAQLNRFYTAQFLSEVKRVLAKDGVVSFALGQYENYVSPELARMLSSACLAAKQSFRNVLAIPGGRVFFLLSDGPLHSDIAARIEQRQIKTKLVNRHYLDATLTPDRLADLANATAQPAAVNRDFSPVLYYYYLRHWLSQFNVQFGLLQVGLLMVLGFYVIRLRGSQFVLFASGFAASALEVVLLLAFQVMCGSVYHQVGVIVTVFMAGLALGAFMANRFECLSSGSLVALALAIACYAAALPWLLPLLEHLGGSAALLVLLKVVIAALTLVLAMLVGMQFPLANRLEFDGTIARASRLYTADFVGAFAGALLACTLLIPLTGVVGVCLLTAGLNAVGGLVGWRRRRSG
jgi:spermidine synthase